MPVSDPELAHLRAALTLGRRQLGATWPNPAVGCVIVRDGRVVARGWTQAGGRPHAEAEAQRRAGEAARGADVFVALEPCAHHGRTPPCADLLAAAGIRRLVAPIEDPDPRVRGAGFARLRAAGVAVESGPLADEARDLHAGFFLRLAAGRPLVALKSATSLDGRIATRTGESRWISGPAALRRAHLLRASHDAVMVGIGTALADDPQLTCRLPGMADRSPVRIVVDRRLRLPLTAQLVRDARSVPSWIITAAGHEAERTRPYVDAGCVLIEAPSGESGLDLAAALQALGARGLTRVLVEGGGHLAAGLLRAGLVDRIHAVRAGLAIGGDGLPVIRPFGVERLADAPRFVRRESAPCGDDVYEVWARA